MNSSELIDKYIADLADWRGNLLAHIRNTVHDVDPEAVEEWKWMGSPCWSHDGLILVANAHQDKVKLTFSQGARLSDPEKLFNAGLQGNRWRAIDLHEGDRIDEPALNELIRAAVAYNQAGKKEGVPAKQHRIQSKSPKE